MAEKGSEKKWGPRVYLERVYPSKGISDLRYTGDGRAYSRFGVAVPLDSDSGDADTVWLSVIVFGTAAEFLAENYQRGGDFALNVEGELRARLTKEGKLEFTLLARNVAVAILDKRDNGNGKPKGASAASGRGVPTVSEDEFPPEDELPF